MTKRREVHQVTAGAASKVEDVIGARAIHMGQERFGVLAHVMTLGAFPIIGRILIIMSNGMTADEA